MNDQSEKKPLCTFFFKQRIQLEEVDSTYEQSEF